MQIRNTILALATLCTPALPSTVTIDSFAVPHAGEEQIRFNVPGSISTGNPVTGITAIAGQSVSFYSDLESSLYTTDPSQPGAPPRYRVKATDNNFLSMSMYMTSGAPFKNARYDLDFRTVGSTGTINFLLDMVSGPDVIASFNTSGNAPAYYSFLASGDFIRSISLTASGMTTADLARPYIGGVSEVPEPGTWALMGSGLMAAVLYARKRRRA